MIHVQLKNRLGGLIKEVKGDKTVTFSHNQPYGFEDELHIHVDPHSFIQLDLDPHLVPSIIYTPTGFIHYVIPAGWKTMAYHPDMFKQPTISFTVSYAKGEAFTKRRNLALNSYDKRWDTGYFPHADANVVTRDEPWFEARNAIDGCIEQEGHGQYPYQSWGGGLRDDLEFQLYFGRPVTIDEIRLYLRADFKDDHDIHWESGVLELSNGTTYTIKTSGSKEPDIITIPPTTVTWIKLHHLKREISAAFSALTQIEVYGTEANR